MPRRSASPSPAATSGHGAAVKNFVVLVLGDVGRSPRMQYHTLSLANLPGKFALCSYIVLQAPPLAPARAMLAAPFKKEEKD